MDASLVIFPSSHKSENKVHSTWAAIFFLLLNHYRIHFVALEMKTQNILQIYYRILKAFIFLLVYNCKSTISFSPSQEITIKPKN